MKRTRSTGAGGRGEGAPEQGAGGRGENPLLFLVLARLEINAFIFDQIITN